MIWLLHDFHFRCSITFCFWFLNMDHDWLIWKAIFPILIHKSSSLRLTSEASNMNWHHHKSEMCLASHFFASSLDRNKSRQNMCVDCRCTLPKKGQNDTWAAEKNEKCTCHTSWLTLTVSKNHSNSLILQHFTEASYARCLKITEKVSFYIVSEASYVYALSGQKLIKNDKNGPFWQDFENLKLAVKQCYQTG